MSKGPYIGPSEAQSAAVHDRDRPHLDDHWRSRKRRRPDGPPTNVDALVAWFAQEYCAEIPDRLHGAGVYVDHGKPSREITVTDRATGELQRKVLPAIEGVGGSLLGSPKDAGLVPYLDGPPHLRDDEGDLVRPMRSALAALRHERYWSYSVVMAVAILGFDWRRLVDKPFHQDQHRHGDAATWCPRTGCRQHDDVTDRRRIIVLTMPEGVLEDVLSAALTRLWWLLAAREPRVREV